MIVAFLLACAVEASPEVTPALELCDATLNLGSVEVTARTATLTPSQGAAGGGAGAEQVAANVATPGTAPLEISALRSDWDLREREVRFQGDVVVVRDQVRLTCDDLVVRYASADRVETVTATGEVVVARGERRATGDRAVLTPEAGQIVLTGQPRLSEGPNRMVGDRIVLWLDDERVECDQCRLVIAGQAVTPREGGR